MRDADLSILGFALKRSVWKNRRKERKERQERRREEEAEKEKRKKGESEAINTHTTSHPCNHSIVNVTL